MKKYLGLTALLLLPAFVLAGAPKVKWKLEKSELTYTVVHPLHVVHGVSLSARGEGIRTSGGTLKFLVAVPVQSFDSGDKNRDLHMQEVTRAGLNPMIKANIEIAKVAEGKAPQSLTADVVIEFAGKKASYTGVKLEVVEWKGGRVHVTGTVPVKLKDFDVTPPSLLTMAVHDDVPVKLDMWWILGIPGKKK